jgi:hypothetical protein
MIKKEKFEFSFEREIRLNEIILLINLVVIILNFQTF